MDFKEFAHRLAPIRGKNNTSRFAKTLFHSIVNEEGADILDDYSESSYKNFYNGHQSINEISKSISVYVDPSEFEIYIEQYGDAVAINLCAEFKDAIPDANPQNIAALLADMFRMIIMDATRESKTGTDSGLYSNIEASSENEKRAKEDSANPLNLLANYKKIVKTSTDFFIDIYNKQRDRDKYYTYLVNSEEYYSTKKTLLYAEKPQPFNDMYVCNDIKCYDRTLPCGGTINEATIPKIEAVSKYVIIEGTGGIGKTMFLTHLFLSTVNSYDINKQIPFFISLKDYRNKMSSLVDLLCEIAREFDEDIANDDIIDLLQEKRVVVLLDGLDEIHNELRPEFDKVIGKFIKSYPNNTIIMTSRPIESFVSFAKFDIFEIKELTKKQALELIAKLVFWDDEIKKKFVQELDRTLYDSHRDFASNPLLLTIMLMTYSSFAEIPAKMHVFYAKAYETMARLHDATKGSYKRPLHTKLTPEEFAKFFSQFCARTYVEQVFEFNFAEFDKYMSVVIAKTDIPLHDVSTRDFLLDLTDNLCILYCEGDKYYFIHRSFQEYFTAVYFDSLYDSELHLVGECFDRMRTWLYTDRTFDMFYDMASKRIDRFIFFPMLDQMFKEFNADDEYWDFLENAYSSFYHDEGTANRMYLNSPQSVLYGKLVKVKAYDRTSDLYGYEWPEEIYNLPTRLWVRVYTNFSSSKDFKKYPNPEEIGEDLLVDKTTLAQDELPYQYTDYFGEPEVIGKSVEIDIYTIRKEPDSFRNLIKAMENPSFPMMQEYLDVKRFYEDMKKEVNKGKSRSLFDD